jgi:uncharacterized membrane protein
MKMGSKKYKYLALISGVIGAIVGGYLWKSLVESGVYADETGTGGYITGFEVSLAVLGTLLLIATVGFLIKYSIEKE